MHYAGDKYVTELCRGRCILTVTGLGLKPLILHHCIEDKNGVLGVDVFVLGLCLPIKRSSLGPLQSC